MASSLAELIKLGDASCLPPQILVEVKLESWQLNGDSHLC